MYRITRRRFLQYGVGAGAALALPAWATPTGRAAPGGKLVKYLEPVPLPGAGIVVAAPSGTNPLTGVTQYAFTQREIERELHPQLPPTPVWAYDDGSGLGGQAGSFGMAVVAETGVALDLSFTNELPETYPDWLPVDTRLTRHGNEVRVMTHLHGGFVAAASDGQPATTPDGFWRGETQTVHYPNEQPATLSWFHDHGFGTTRLNVFAGLAAAYLLRDANDPLTEPNPAGIPGGLGYEIPLVIQDRAFDDDGTFLYPVSEITGVTWIGEYFGDVMLVNGKVWPFLDVEPRLYRFRVLNGCNSRILQLRIPGADVWQIGAEGGMWDVPVPAPDLVLAPAERADLIVDFRKLAGRVTQLRNSPPRRPVVTPGQPLNQVMEIRVGTTVTAPGPAAVPASLPGVAANLPEPDVKRFITLNEVEPESDEWRLTVNGRRFDEPLDPELDEPKEGAVEDWYYVNLTGDTHPMHPHLFLHQVIGRVPFDVAAYVAAAPAGEDGVFGGFDPTPFATGPMIPPKPTERGFKDTTQVHPGQFAIIRAKFDLPTGVDAPQTYVHHCHIVEHEDNDMMRPFTVQPS